jgi:carbonic anhydrase
MTRISWVYDASLPSVGPEPGTPTQAMALLDSGNAEFASLRPGADEPHVHRVSASELGFGAVPGVAPAQTPFAALLGCADARAPLELVFMQSANDLFAVRVAGNVLGSECVGSLDYAVANLASVRLLAVIGHTGCGAVTAAVEAYLDPTAYLGISGNLPLRAIVDAILPAVRAADRSLQAVHGADVQHLPGFRAALVDTAVVLNAAGGAEAIADLFSARLGGSLGVAFGVYDLATRTVGLPAAPQAGFVWQPGLVVPPEGEQFPDLVTRVAQSEYVRALLRAREPAAR